MTLEYLTCYRVFCSPILRDTPFRYLRLIVVEVLRLYPQPPLLIRRSLTSDQLPGDLVLNSA